MQNKPKIYIIGTSGYASEITELILSDREYDIAGYFDIANDDYNKYNYVAPFLGNEDNYNFKSEDNIIIAISNNIIRNKVYEKLKLKGLRFPSVIHSSAFISRATKISEGAIISQFVTLTSNIKIGKNFQANIYSYIAHDCKIGNNVTFAPSVKCNGNVVIEDDVYIGTGVIIHQGKPDKPLIIGKGSTIAAGSVVTKSIKAGQTVFGNPAIELTKENLKRRR